MPSTSEIILSNKTATDGSSLTSFEGEKFKGDGYYGRSDGFHTVQYDFSGLSGDIIIQATIATNPTNDDWFDVHTYTANVETATKYHNFTGNFVWIRAKLSITDGTVNSIRMNH
tara:strand:- start:3041 stop:3382 length:342 start_codon:yes stop_codon:yes gene_type:complete